MMIDKDKPIQTKVADILNRGNFVRSIVHLLENNNDEESTVIGLYGPWGSGKTSIINLIQEQLRAEGNSTSGRDEHNDCIVVDFNPWLYSNMKDLVREFFTCMSEALGKKGNILQSTIELLNEYKWLISPVSSLVGLPVAVKEILEGLMRQNQRQSLSSIKESLNCQMMETKQKIVVFIDDIDRLPDEEIAAIFRLVKAVADFPFVTYVLSFDYDVVTKALDRVQHDKGAEYLEKIVQMPISIPSIRREYLSKYLDTKLGAIFCDEEPSKFQNKRWWQLRLNGINQYMTSIRNINRYCNEVRLSYYALKGDANVIDLLGISCLRVFENRIYQKLPAYKGAICNNGRVEFMRRPDVPDILNKMAEEFKNRAYKWNAVSEILGGLFPKFSSMVQQTEMNSEDYNESGISFHSVHRAENFDRYFIWNLTEYDIPTEEVRNFLFQYEPLHMKKTLLAYKRQGMQKRFIEELESSISNKWGDKLSEERARQLISTILSIYIEIYEIEIAFFAVSLEWYVFSLVDTILKVISDNYRFSFIKSLFEDESIHISGPELLLNGYRGQVRSRVGNIIFSKDEIRELEHLFLDRGEKIIETNNYYDDYGLKFWGVLQAIDPAVMEQYGDQLVRDDVSLVKVLECCIHNITSSAEPYYFKRFDKKCLTEFILPELAYQRMNELAKNSKFKLLKQAEKEAVIVFLISEERTPVNIGDLDGVTDNMILDRLQKIESECTD